MWKTDKYKTYITDIRHILGWRCEDGYGLGKHGNGGVVLLSASGMQAWRPFCRAAGISGLFVNTKMATGSHEGWSSGVPKAEAQGSPHEASHVKFPEHGSSSV